MAKPNLYITFRVTPEEKEILQNYSERAGRAQSDVLREFIRNLEKRTSRSPHMTQPAFIPCLKYEVRCLRTSFSGVFGIFLIRNHFYDRTKDKTIPTSEPKSSTAPLRELIPKPIARFSSAW